MRRLLLTLCFVFSLLPGRLTPCFAQVAAGALQGHVLCSDGNVPARGATVSLARLEDLLPKEGAVKEKGPTPPETTTDFFGAYEIHDIPPGTYLVAVKMRGYSDDFALARQMLPRFTPDEQKGLLAAFPQVVLHGSETLHQELTLTRAGAVSGQVNVDAGGTVPAGSLVTASMTAGKLIGTAADTQHPIEFTQTALTDDQGMYRISGLPPGTYTVSVRVYQFFLNTTVNGCSAAAR